jgi:hypothetical protein
MFSQNKTLRDANKRLQKHTDSLSTENSEMRIRLGLTPPVSPEPSPCHVSLPPSPEPSHNKDDSQNDWVVIKKEIESKEFAALTASQQQKNLILFLLVITTWLRINTR